MLTPWITYGFLALGIISLWYKKHWAIWGGLLCLTAVFGILSSRLNWVGVASLVLMGLIILTYYRLPLAGVRKGIADLIVVAVGSMAILHWLPGFNNLKVLSDVHFSPDAIAYSLSLNFDKAAFGLLILAFGCKLISSGKQLKQALVRQAKLDASYRVQVPVG